MAEAANHSLSCNSGGHSACSGCPCAMWVSAALSPPRHTNGAWGLLLAGQIGFGALWHGRCSRRGPAQHQLRSV